MIKIEKVGSLPKKSKNEYRCKCSICGCQFVAGIEDVSKRYSNVDGEIIFVHCPTKNCDEVVKGEKIVYRDGVLNQRFDQLKSKSRT